MPINCRSISSSQQKRLLRHYQSQLQSVGLFFIHEFCGFPCNGVVGEKRFPLWLRIFLFFISLEKVLTWKLLWGKENFSFVVFLLRYDVLGWSLILYMNNVVGLSWCLWFDDEKVEQLRFVFWFMCELSVGEINDEKFFVDNWV